MAVLALTVFFSGNSLKEWIGACAVFVTFLHAQVGDRMAAGQAAMPDPSVPCHPWSTRYYVSKEFLWIIYFILSGTWSALAGGFIFLLYPFWRKYYRLRQSVV